MSEVRIVVSVVLPALKNRAATAPKPQLVSSDRTAKGKARTLLEGAGRVVSLRGKGNGGNLILKGMRAPLPGTVSTAGTRMCCAKTEKVLSHRKKISNPALIYNMFPSEIETQR